MTLGTRRRQNAFHHVALSLTRPPNYDDAAMVLLLRQVVEEAACIAIDITAVGLVVECEAAGLEVLETALRTNLRAHGGSLEKMIARRL